MLNIFIFVFASYFHPIHVSVCDVTQNKEKVDLTFKVFFDDLQTSMGLHPGEEINAKYAGSDQLINEFIQKNTRVYVNGKQVKLKYKESYSSPPAVWTEMELVDVKASEIKSFEIVNDIMVNMYKDQTNIVNIAMNNQKKNFALDRNQRSAKLKF